MLNKIKEKLVGFGRWVKDKTKKFWKWLVGGIVVTALAAPLLIPSYPVEHVTAPENNAFKIGVMNYEYELKDDITADASLQYKLEDKYISFKPVGMKWSSGENYIKVVVGEKVKEDEANYKEVFGKGINLAVNTSSRVWNKVVEIESLEDLGTIPKEAEYLEIEFEVETNFVIDGWNKQDDFEIMDKVRLGDFSYIEPAMAWDSYNEVVETTLEDGETTYQTLTNEIRIKSFFKKGKYVKQILVDWLKTAQYPVYSDADVTYGTASEFDDGGVSQFSGTAIAENKFVACWSDGSLGECRVGSVSGTTITWGAASTFDADIVISGQYPTTDVCKLDDDKFVVVYADDSLADDGWARAVTVSGETIGTWGTADEYNNSDTERQACAPVDTDKFIVVWNDETEGNVGEGAACSVSGTTISCGTEVVTGASGEAKYHACDQNGTDKFVCAYGDGGDGTDGYAVVGTTSNTTIAFGTPSEFSDYVGGVDNFSPTGLRVLDTDKFAVVYDVLKTTSPFNLEAETRAGTIATTTITWGTVAVQDASGGYGCGMAAIDSTHYVANCADAGDSSKGKSRYNTVDFSDRSITLGDQEYFHETGDAYPSATDLISANKIVIMWVDVTDSTKGFAIIGDTPSEEPAARRRWDTIPK